MNTAVINIKTSPQTKAKAKEVANELGFSLSSLVNAFLRQLIKTKTITFSSSDEEPTEYMLQALKESKDDIKKGHVISFDSWEQEKEYFKHLITNDKKLRKS